MRDMPRGEEPRGRGAAWSRRLRWVSRGCSRADAEARVRDMSRPGDEDRARWSRDMHAVSRRSLGRSRKACRMHELSCRQEGAATWLDSGRMRVVPRPARTQGTAEPARLQHVPFDAQAPRAALDLRARRELRVVSHVARTSALGPRDVHRHVSRRSTRPPARRQDLQGLPHLPQLSAQALNQLRGDGDRSRRSRAPPAPPPRG